MRLHLKSKYCISLFLGMLVSGCISIPKTYSEAKQVSISQKTILEQWVKDEDIAFNVFDIKFAGCLENVPREKISSQELIVGINEHGEVTQVYLEKTSEIGNCLASALQTQKFPKPPVMPAYLILDLDFTLPEERIDDGPVVKDVIN